MKKFLKLTSASGRQINTIYVKAQSINLIEEPKSKEEVGCILYVMAQQIPVKESLETVLDMLDKCQA